MTTDDHTQPCDCHKQTLAKLDRILELLEDRRDARRARIDAEITTLADPERVYTTIPGLRHQGRLR